MQLRRFVGSISDAVKERLTDQEIEDLWRTEWSDNRLPDDLDRRVQVDFRPEVSFWVAHSTYASEAAVVAHFVNSTDTQLRAVLCASPSAPLDLMAGAPISSHSDLSIDRYLDRSGRGGNRRLRDGVLRRRMETTPLGAVVSEVSRQIET